MDSRTALALRGSRSLAHRNTSTVTTPINDGMLIVNKKISLLTKVEQRDIIAMISKAQERQKSQPDIERILNSLQDKIQALSIAANDDTTGMVRLAAETLDAANDIVQKMCLVVTESSR